MGEVRSRRGYSIHRSHPRGLRRDGCNPRQKRREVIFKPALIGQVEGGIDRWFLSKEKTKEKIKRGIGGTKTIKRDISKFTKR